MYFYKDHSRIEASEVALDAGRLFNHGSKHLKQKVKTEQLSHSLDAKE